MHDFASFLGRNSCGGDISLVIVLIGMDGVVGSLCLALGLQNFILYWLVSVLGRFGSPN